MSADSDDLRGAAAFMGGAGAPKLALVTGASSGMGAASTVALAAAGWSLVLQGRDAERSERSRRTAAARAAPEARIDVCLADLAGDEGVERVAAAVDGRPLHALVHAAGTIHLGHLGEVPMAAFDAQIALNLRAPYALTRALLPALREARGHVVMVNSTAGQRANPGWSGYAASKFGLRAVADALRQEEPALRVTSLYPGRTATPMQAAVHEAEAKAYEPGRFVRPEDVAAQVVALLELPRPSLVSELTIAPG